MLCSRGRQQFTRTVLILIRDMNETGVTVGEEGPKRKIFHFIWSFKSMHNFLMHPRQEFLNCCFNERSISFVIQRLPNIEKKHRSYSKRGQ